MAREDLDRKAKLVLEAVYELGGEADTSEVKDYTGIDSNGVVHYRYDKLEDVGLVETRTVDRGGTLDVTVATLTDRGHERVGDILDNGDGPTVVDQVTDLKRLVRELRDEVRHFEGRLDAVEGEYETVDSWEERFQEMEDHFEVMERRTEGWSRCLTLVNELEDSGLIDGFVREADHSAAYELKGPLRTSEWVEKKEQQDRKRLDD